MNMHELEKKTEQELQELLAELRGELHTLRFQAASGQLKQVDQIKKVRQNIARVITMRNKQKHQKLNQVNV